MPSASPCVAYMAHLSHQPNLALFSLGSPPAPVRPPTYLRLIREKSHLLPASDIKEPNSKPYGPQAVPMLRLETHVG